MTPSAEVPTRPRGPGGVATPPSRTGAARGRRTARSRDVAGTVRGRTGETPRTGNNGNGGWDEFGFTPSGFDAAAGFYNWLLSNGEVVCDGQTFRLHGLVPDSTQGSFEDFLAQVLREETPRRCSEMLDPLLATVGDYAFEYRVQLPDGRIRTLESRGRVVADPGSGKPSRMMGIVSDVTERRAAELEALRRAAVAARMQEVTAGLASAGSLLELHLRGHRRAARPRCQAVRSVTDAGQPAEIILEWREPG